MSRRKQAKPRALKRELEEDGTEDPETVGTMTTDVVCREACSTSQPSETGDEQMSICSDTPTSGDPSQTTLPDPEDDAPDVVTSHGDAVTSAHDVSVTAVGGEVDDDVDDTAEESEEVVGEEEYRCDVCGDTFTSLTHFMDHRNFECSPEETGGWRRCSPTASRTSSPYSTEDGRSPLTDSPLSPTAAQIPVDLLPYTVGVSEGHPYPCQFCDKAFSRLSFLKKHEQVHGDLMPFRCEFCHRLFKHKRSRDRHLKLHTGDRKYRCPHCNSAFSRSDHLKIHLKTHDQAKPFQCPACSRGFSTAAALTAHALSHSKTPAANGDSDYQCGICQDRFTLEHELQTHVLAHELPGSSPGHVEKVYQCEQCQEVYIGRAALEAHIRDVHSASFRRTCPICDAVFTNTDDLLIHIRRHSTSPQKAPSVKVEHKAGGGGGLGSSAKKRKVCAEDKHDCPYCSKKGFPSREVLEIHVRTMHMEKSTQMHVCQYCNAAYPTLNDLEDHIKIIHHTSLGIKFSCEFCTLEFSEFLELKAHLDKVHKYAEFCGNEVDIVFCSQCTMGFPNAFALSEHVHNAHTISIPVKNGSSPGFVLKKEKPSRPSSASSVTNNKPYREPFSSPSSHLEKLPSHPARLESSANGPSVNGELSSKTCDECNATFLDNKSYQAHMSSHLGTSNSKYSCAECASEFSSEDQLESHVFVHFLALTTEYGCTSCLKLFSKPDELQKHLMDIHAHHLYRCSLCKEIFDSKVNIQVHFAIKHSNECKLYKCMPCGSVFRSEMEWQLHVKVHHLGMSKPYRCLFCKESFSTEVELQCHLTTHKKQFPCPLCDEAFHVEYLLDKHIQTKHAPEDPSSASTGLITPKEEKDTEILDYSMSGAANTAASLPTTPTPSRSPKVRTPPSPVCHGSNQVMAQPAAQTTTFSPPHSNHSQHSTSVTPPLIRKGDLNYKCDICDVKFSEDAALQKHRLNDHSISPEMSLALQKAQAAAVVEQQQQQQNTQPQAQVSPKSGGVDKFSQLCVYCNKTFKTKGELEKHMKTHASPSNQKCNICDEVFPSASILAEHKLTHCKVVKGNVCVVCKVAMKNEEQFYAHAQQHGFQGTNMQCIVCRQTLASMLELQMHGKHHFQSPASFYTCCVCLGSFDAKENLISKLNSSGRTYYVCKPCYHGDLVSEFRCPTCSVKFETQAALETHMATHKKTYQCIKCQQSFASEYEIQMHVATHVMQEGNIHDCKICGTVFDSPAKLQCHLIEHTFESGEIRCYVCNALFTHAGAIQMHVLEHGLGARRYACPHCPQSFFFASELQNHLLSAHATRSPAASNRSPQQMELQCPECPKTFTSLLALGAHRKAHDKKPSPPPAPAAPPAHSSTNSPGQETLKCSLCPELFAQLGDLQHHFLSVHAADAELLQRKGALSMAAIDDTVLPDVTSLRKVYQCTECGKDCNSLSHLQSHSKVHSSGKENRKAAVKVSTKPFPCPICGRTFTRKTHLKDHMKVHLQNVQPSSYACEFCSETFPNTKLLRRHLVSTHNTTDTDHACRVCGDTFPHGRHLATHLTQVHGVVMATDVDAMETEDADQDGGGGEEPSDAVGSPVYENGCSTAGTSQGRDLKLVTKATDNNSKFAGVTVVTNPPEQVTVS